VSDKLDKIQEDVTEIKISIVEIQKDINYHIMRTDLAEENLNTLKQEVLPIKQHVERVNFLVKIGIFLGGLAAFLAAIKSLF
jgi:hypothetical protein